MKNITFQILDIKTLPVYHLTSTELTLPMGRNKEKDTYNYLCNFNNSDLTYRKFNQDLLYNL